MLQQTRVAVVEDRYRKFVAQFPIGGAAVAGERDNGAGGMERAGILPPGAGPALRSQEVVAQGGVSRHGDRADGTAGCWPVYGCGCRQHCFWRARGRGGWQRKDACSSALPASQLTNEQYWQAAGALVDPKRPGDFNQAMMELGALVCLPGQPLCHTCPVHALCASRGATETAKRQARRKAILHYALLRRNGSVFLQQRGKQSSLMPGMWELPPFEPGNNAHAPLLKLRHSITTTDYTVFVHASGRRTGRSAARTAGKGRWVLLRSIHRFPLTGLTRKIVERLENV